jgi:hypothetical protein
MTGGGTLSDALEYRCIIILALSFSDFISRIYEESV